MAKTFWSALGLSNVLAKLKGLYEWNYTAIEALFDKLSPIMPQAGAVVHEIDIRIKQALKDAASPGSRFEILQAYFYPGSPMSDKERQALMEMAQWPVRFILQEVGVLLLSRYLPRVPAERVMRAAIELAAGLLAEGAAPLPVNAFLPRRNSFPLMEDLTRYR